MSLTIDDDLSSPPPPPNHEPNNVGSTSAHGIASESCRWRADLPVSGERPGNGSVRSVPVFTDGCVRGVRRSVRTPLPPPSVIQLHTPRLCLGRTSSGGGAGTGSVS